MSDDDPEDIVVEVGTLLSSRTKRGLVELKIGEAGSVQMEIAKAREICQMLHEAIEAAVSDTLIFQFLTQRVGLDDERAARALGDFRVLRQGSKGAVRLQ